MSKYYGFYSFVFARTPFFDAIILICWRRWRLCRSTKYEGMVLFTRSLVRLRLRRLLTFGVLKKNNGNVCVDARTDAFNAGWKLKLAANCIGGRASSALSCLDADLLSTKVMADMSRSEVIEKTCYEKKQISLAAKNTPIIVLELGRCAMHGTKQTE